MQVGGAKLSRMVLLLKPAPPPPQLTYADYAEMPNDGRRYELIEGEFFVTPAPSSFHQTVSRRLQHQLMIQLEDRKLAYVFNAPFDVIFNDINVMQPDLAIIRTSHRELISKRGLEGPPDIAVEVLSPSSRNQDQRAKSVAYAKLGVPEYWIVDPDAGTLTVWRASGGVYAQAAEFTSADTLSSVEFPEIAVALGPIFEPF